jgi:hypothetical protein
MVFAGTGELPFRGESLTATAYAILHSDPHMGRLPEPLGALVYRCLDKDPAGRPSARAVLGELVAAGARPVGPMPPMAAALADEDAIARSQRAAAAAPKPRPDSGDGLIAGRPAGSRSARHGSRRSKWRRRLPVVLAAILLVVGIDVIAFHLPRHGASQRLSGSQVSTQPTVNPELAAEAGARTKAVDWILQQVSQAAIVSCDPLVCGQLLSGGFPSGNVLTLGPASNDPLGSTLVVATASIRSHFGKRLADVYAPELIASFGSGAARIDIRLVYPGGAAKYAADEQKALRYRKGAGAELLANSQIRVSATARAQLLSGHVDPRLPQLLAIMVESHPVSIVDFGGQSPGGGPASLLRSVDLAIQDSAAHLSRAAYLGWMQGFINAQRAQYLPSTGQITLPAGQIVLRIGYAVPSPLS